ncbi:AAA-like domain-containing protein [Okeania sp. SIO1F9]|uniref:AAA-like domain-containing protein n=1 Tax=Okeania sp. SIO1F9 TaxID=2607813 RepID=UPI00144DCBBC|nr:AAA-like domain-containing protein [Okeania sp. SIO1F9]NET78677.1 hypothetical protein [Okeania sp. SIO1F9]
MKSESEFTWSQAKERANQIIFQNTGTHLSDLEILILQGAWEKQTYIQIAQENGYSAEYLNKDVGNKMWSKFSTALGEKITKKNFKEALQRWKEDNNNQFVSSIVKLPFPEGAVALDSPLYIERENVENLCYQTIENPGSLIRIKAPKLMGKTSLIMRILAQAKAQNYRTVYLDLSSVNRTVITNLYKFLKWLCLTVGRQLNLENQLDNYWDTEILGSNDNCTVYFEEYLLTEIDTPLVLCLDAVDRLFPYTEVIEDFFGMLRFWHERGKISDVWKRLRLVIAHSTEVYIPLDINQSPFNAGLPIELSEFNHNQVQRLAQLHGINWNNYLIQELMKIVGGHPYLLRLAMYEIWSHKITLEQLLKEAATEAGVYSNHLRRNWETLQKLPGLTEAFKQVVTSSEPVELDSKQIYQLHSMGLVKQKDNYVMPQCHLYQDYFRRVL